MYFLIAHYNGVDQFDNTFTIVEEYEDYNKFMEARKNYEEEPFWRVERSIKGEEID